VAREHHFHAAAAQHYQDALHLQTIHSGDRLRISEKLAEALSLGEDPGAATPWYDLLLRSYRTHPENAIETVEILLRTTRQLWIASQTEATLPVLSQATHLAELSKNGALLKSTHVAMASAFIQLARYRDAKRCLYKFGKIGIDDAPPLRASYWVQKGLIAAAFGEEANAFQSFEHAVEAVQNDPDLYSATSVWTNYANAATRLGRTEFAKTCHERALWVARRNNVAWRIPDICLDYAWLLTRMGQYELAHEYLMEALSYDVKAAILDENFVFVGIPLAIYMKDEATLEKCIRPHVIDLAFQSGEPSRIGLTAAAFAQLYIAQGNSRTATALLHRAINAIEDIDCAWNLPIEIARCGAVSDLARARKLLATRRASPCVDVIANAHLRLFDAFVAQRQKRAVEAQVQARDAVECFEILRWSMYADLARSILPAEQRLSRGENHEEKPFADMTATLTDREREVAALVLKGLTSRKIAAKLSISPHTVDSHVNSIMSRLGIRSRHQLAYVLPDP
jgi:DNA-binding CsgD family transcriptional regulator/tetratricopeptide (TPR) repeat protein